MKLVQVLKLCVCGAFIATIITGTIFMVRSSADDQSGKQMKGPHETDIVQDAVDDHGDGKARFPEEQKAPKKGGIIDVVEEDKKQQRHDTKEGIDNEQLLPQKHPKNIKKQQVQQLQPLPAPTTQSTTIEHKVLKELKSASAATPPSIHIFYYPWYGSPAFNKGRFYHWNHRYLPKWKATKGQEEKEGAHVPPGDIASVFYPSLGPYSSWDAKVIERHMKWMSSAGIDVVACSWYPKGMADMEGMPWDSLIPTLLNATEKAKMKMAFHLEPYDQRTATTVRRDIAYILEQYGQHPALYRRSPAASGNRTDDNKDDGANTKTKELPLFYVYDSYRIGPAQWATVLGRNGTDTIRGTELDSLMIGLYVDNGDAQKLMDASFDGLYTYFAADGFSHGSTMTNWPDLSAFCARNGLLFVPSVGPGYNDTRVRPWNSANARGRANGEYYREHFKMAHTAKADIVSITSFNEWHEGTQIEPAMPFKAPSTNKNNNSTITSTANGGGGADVFVYAKYDGGPEQYLEITLEMVKQYFTAHHEDIPAKIAPIV